MTRVRLDELLVSRGIATDVKHAAALLMDGTVLVDGRPGAKPGTLVRGQQIEMKPVRKYVSRGGLKLEAALDRFGISPLGWVCADLGCSTGGFTDCLLQRGARRVYAFDVGHGVLDWTLRQDSRVVLREGFNVRLLAPPDVSEPVSLVAADLSFISLRLILPVLPIFEGAQFLLLVKPQFEAERHQVEPGGLISDPGVRAAVLRRVVDTAIEAGFEARGELECPVRGQKGNVEYFLWLKR